MRKDLQATIVFTVLSIALFFVPSPRGLIHGKQRGTPVSARVMEVDNSTLQVHGLLRFGTQQLKVKILAGPQNGRIVRAANELRAQMELDKEFNVGDRVLVIVTGDDADDVLVVTDYDRSYPLAFLAAAFALLLISFAGWTGAKALISFVFSCAAIWKLVIPAVLVGWNASGVVFGAVVILTAVIDYLVAGWTGKGFVAFAGSSVGLLVGLAAAHGFGRLMHINGATLPYVQTLFYSGFENLNIADVFVGAVILACSGAVMDLAMDIAAGVEEVKHHNETLGFKALLFSGVRIGRAVVGTMTTTLLLAYSGGYLTLLMMFYVQGTHPLVLLNNPLVAAEIVKTLIGSFSLIFVAPCTALIAGWAFSRCPKNRALPSFRARERGTSGGCHP